MNVHILKVSKYCLKKQISAPKKQKKKNLNKIFIIQGQSPQTFKSFRNPGTK